MGIAQTLADDSADLARAQIADNNIAYASKAAFWLDGRGKITVQCVLMSAPAESKPSIQHVRDRGDGDLRVGQTDVPLESVYWAYRQGESPESIRSSYRSLSLQDVYGAISWMLDHPAETDAYIERQKAIWEEARRQSEAMPCPARDRLRAMKQTAAKK